MTGFALGLGVATILFFYVHFEPVHLSASNSSKNKMEQESDSVNFAGDAFYILQKNALKMNVFYSQKEQKFSELYDEALDREIDKLIISHKESDALYDSVLVARSQADAYWDMYIKAHDLQRDAFSHYLNLCKTEEN